MKARNLLKSLANLLSCPPTFCKRKLNTDCSGSSCTICRYQRQLYPVEPGSITTFGLFIPWLLYKQNHDCSYFR